VPSIEGCHELPFGDLAVVIPVGLTKQFLQAFGHGRWNLVWCDYAVVIRIETVEHHLGVGPFGPLSILCRRVVWQRDDRQGRHESCNNPLHRVSPRN